jgi:L-asparaginase
MPTRLDRTLVRAIALLGGLLFPVTGGVSAQSPGGAPPAAAPLPKVTVVGTGGTIAAVSSTRTSFQSYRSGQILIEDMVNELRPQIDEVAEVNTVQFGNRGSGGYGIADYHDLTLAVEKALETADAVVVTSGTDTMDEIIYWLDLTVQSSKPVVITGAMRPWTVIGTDGPANLFNAIVLAASGETTCFGSVLMLNDEFHAAKDVFKEDAYRMDTFSSRRMGILGFVDGLDVKTFRAPPRIQRCGDPASWNTPFNLAGVPRDGLPRVEILIGYQGGQLDEAARAMAEGGARGLILTAGGGLSREARTELEERGVVIISTPRFRTGENNLVPQKARLLLMTALAFSSDPAQVRAWYEEWGNMQFTAPR